MSRKKRLFPADAFRSVLGFTFRHWSRQPARIALICGLVIASTLAEVMVPLFSGRIVDAIAGSDNTALGAALFALLYNVVGSYGPTFALMAAFPVAGTVAVLRGVRRTGESEVLRQSA